MSYTQTLYHIVLRTHRSEKTIVIEKERDFYTYALGFINNVGGKLFRIGGMPDHVHILVSLPATLAMSKFVQDFKVATSKWLKNNPDFPNFDGWTKEYAGFTYNMRDRQMISNYIARQKEHHMKKSFAEEYRAFLVDNGIEIKEEFFSHRLTTCRLSPRGIPCAFPNTPHFGFASCGVIRTMVRCRLSETFPVSDFHYPYL